MMAEPVRDPETGGRSLADILREAGIENPSRSGRRRRWDDMDDGGIRQRRADAEAAAARAAYGRRSGDVPLDRTVSGAAGPRRDEEFLRDVQPERDRRRGEQERRRPREDRAGRVEPAARERPARLEQNDQVPRGQRAGRPAGADPSTAAIPGLRPSRTPSVPEAPVVPAATTRTDRSGARRPFRADSDAAAPSTGPIPALQADDIAELADDLDADPRDSALAWLRFGGELLIAAAAGVGIYLAFTVLWQTLPHVAVVVAPLAVTGLVAGVSVWRQRFGHAQLSARLLAVLVFAGTLLTVLPAAGLITQQ